MQEYVTIFDSIPWKAVGISVLQTFILYCALIVGLKLVGRRVFGQLGPQELVVLLIIAEATNQGLTHQNAGYWGSFFSVLTILFIGGVVERTSPLRNLLEDYPVPLFGKDGQPDENQLKHCLVGENDLQQAARKYGTDRIEDFEMMTLESDGRISGTLKPELRGQRTRIEQSSISG